MFTCLAGVHGALPLLEALWCSSNEVQLEFLITLTVLCRMKLKAAGLAVLTAFASNVDCCECH